MIYSSIQIYWTQSDDPDTFGESCGFSECGDSGDSGEYGDFVEFGETGDSAYYEFIDSCEYGDSGDSCDCGVSGKYNKSGLIFGTQLYDVMLQRKEQT